jgi:hypothetical protein
VAESRSLEVFKGIREAQQKLDYFLLGLVSALFAYVGGQYKPMPISFSQNTIELISLALFFISIIAGFKRLDLNISIMKLNFQMLDMGEKKGALNQAQSMPGQVLNTDTGEVLGRNEAAYTLQLIEENTSKVKTNLDKLSNYSSATFVVRNWALILGFLALGFSKVLGVYVVSTIV